MVHIPDFFHPTMPVTTRMASDFYLNLTMIQKMLMTPPDFQLDQLDPLDTGRLDIFFSPSRHQLKKLVLLTCLWKLLCGRLCVRSQIQRRVFFGNEEMNQTDIWPFKMIDPKKIDGWKLQNIIPNLWSRNW